MHRDARPVRVAAVDEHPVVIEGLAGLLSRTDGFDFVGGWPSADDLPGDVSADVVLLELDRAGGRQVRDIVRLLLAGGAQVVIYTDGTRRAWMADALIAGAAGVVCKGQGMPELIQALRAAAAGELSFPVELASTLREASTSRPRLAPRELSVLLLAAEGHGVKHVASVLEISEETVKTYLKRIRKKYADLGRPAGSRIQLRERAVEDGHTLPDGISV